MNDPISPEQTRGAVLALATQIDCAAISLRIQAEAKRLASTLGDTAWPYDAPEEMIREVGDVLFIISHRVEPKDGPFPNLAVRLKKLLDLILPETRQDPDEGCPVLTPAEAGTYLGMHKLGVVNPAASVRHLVKKRDLRSVNISGRMAFVRSDLDEYLTRLSAQRRKR